MSDSYSAWCEEQESRAWDNELKKIKSFLRSLKWKNAVSNCNENLQKVKFDVVKVCATCASCCTSTYQYNHATFCSTLGSEIKCPEYLKCNKWTISNALARAKEKQKVFNQDIMVQHYL